MFSLSLRDVELLLAERGIIVSYEMVRRWCRKFGQSFAHGLQRRRPRPGDEASRVSATLWHRREEAARLVDSVRGSHEYGNDVRDSASWCQIRSMRHRRVRGWRRVDLSEHDPSEQTYDEREEG